MCGGSCQSSWRLSQFRRLKIQLGGLLGLCYLTIDKTEDIVANVEAASLGLEDKRLSKELWVGLVINLVEREIDRER